MEHLEGARRVLRVDGVGEVPGLDGAGLAAEVGDVVERELARRAEGRDEHLEEAREPRLVLAEPRRDLGCDARVDAQAGEGELLLVPLDELLALLGRGDVVDGGAGALDGVADALGELADRGDDEVRRVGRVLEVCGEGLELGDGGGRDVAEHDDALLGEHRERLRGCDRGADGGGAGLAGVDAGIVGLEEDRAVGGGGGLGRELARERRECGRDERRVRAGDEVDRHGDSLAGRCGGSGRCGVGCGTRRVSTRGRRRRRRARRPTRSSARRRAAGAARDPRERARRRGRA